MYPAPEPSEPHQRRPKLPAWHYWVYWAGVGCALAAALTMFGVIHRPGRSTPSTIPANESAARSGPFHGMPSTHLDDSQRRLYPYSVIPGGVANARELRNAIERDPAVAELYANFDLSSARVVPLKRDREVYVSYRLGNQIYWTKKRLLLRAGETVITDGKHEARTRCGNRVSETPVQPVSDGEPANAALNASPIYSLFADNAGPAPLPTFNQPVDPIIPGLPSALQPPASPISTIPPPSFPIVGGGPPSFPSIIPPSAPPPPVATPEPSSLSLVETGIMALVALAVVSSLPKSHES